jgi:hypothetical protein
MNNPITFLKNNILYILNGGDVKMLFMIAFWICLVLAIIILIINRSLKNNHFESLATFFIFIQFIFALVAIGTKDPIFQTIGLPAGYEWIAGLTLSGTFLWMFYLNPLKNRVIDVEKDTSSIKTSIIHIGDDVKWIKENCAISFKKK